MKLKNKKGFTLIEILTVIAIIGILAAILIPATGKAMDSARKTKESSNLRQIALAYMAYSMQDGESTTINQPTIHEWINTLAEQSPSLTPQLFILKNDPLVQQKNTPIPSSFKDTNFKKSPISFTIVNNLAPNASPSTTPIAWTRGLLPSGKWASLNSNNPGTHGDQGGYIAFLDGHVTWFTDLSKDGGQLLHYIHRTPTANILEAINPGAQPLDSTQDNS